MLRDLSVGDTSVDPLGTRVPSPLFLCTIGVPELAHRDADVAVACAAAAEGVPIVSSHQASHPMEKRATALTGCASLDEITRESVARRGRWRPSPR